MFRKQIQWQHGPNWSFWLMVAWYGVLSVAVGKAAVDLLGMLLYELGGPLNGDALIYLTIGRGILNGLRTYADLFESKPPGIFYLSAASLFLTNGDAILRVWEVGSLLVLPVAFTGYACVCAARKRMDAITLVAIAFLSGSLLALRTQEQAGGLQTEMFGVPLVTLYALLITLDGRRFSPARIVSSGLLLLGALAIREPFLLAAFAAAILETRSLREFATRFLLPAAIAVALGIVLLWTLGLLEPYVQSYLPAMLLHRIDGGTLDPLLLRALWLHRLFSSLTSFSSMPLLGYTLGGLWILTIATKERPNWRGAGLAACAAIAGVLCLHYVFVLAVLLYQTSGLGMTTWQVFADPGFLLIDMAYVVGFVGYAAFLYFIGKKVPQVLPHIGCGLLALLVLSVSIGLGGYSPNYMLYALPAIVVCFLQLFRHATDVAYRFIAIVVAVLLSISAISYRALEENKYGQFVGLSATARERSASLDRLMDACGFERYAFLGGFPEFAFSQHSPIGPIFTLYFHNYLGFDDPLYQKTFASIRDGADLLLQPIEPPKTADPLPRQIRDLFTAEAPPCARGLTPPAGYTVFYRS